MTRFVAHIALTIFLFAGGGSVLAQNGRSLADFPFWKKMEGYWESENTYFDANMDYQVRSYSSLVHVELNGHNYHETEHRFYPAGLSTSRYGKGLMQPGEGIELVVTTTGKLIDDAGTLGNIYIDHAGSSGGPNVAYHMLGENDAVRTNTIPETGVDNYRMYFNFTTPDRRFRSNFGLLGNDKENLGGLRAFILYRDHRIDSANFENRRAAIREQHKVKVISRAHTDGTRQSMVTRLD
ncbi:MAG: hypothetical protein P8L79_00205 [Rhodospirillaceae bacterium]|nr:hypothetical protein [Rhodospirillaceae bacterium]